jgi:hypothetical protein
VLSAICKEIDPCALRRRQLNLEIEAGCADRDASVSRRHLPASRLKRLSNGS